MKNQHWRVVAFAGVTAGAVAVSLVPGCSSSDSTKKVSSTFHPDAGNSAGEAGASTSGSGGSSGQSTTAGSGGTSKLGGEAGMSSEGGAGGAAGAGAAGEGGAAEAGAGGAAEAGAAGEGPVVVSSCGVGEACCASSQCETGLECLGPVCSCVADLSNQYLLRPDGVAFYTATNDTSQTVVTNADTGMPLHGIIGIMGTNYHGCAALDTGEARCWSLVADATGNNSGQLGNGTVGGTNPVLVGSLVKTDADTNLSDVISVGADADTYGSTTTTCAVTKAGSVYCWGNGAPQVINAATTPTPFATQINTAAAGPALTGATQATVGNAHACVLTNGKVRCWGSIDGTGVTRAYPDTDVVGIPGNISKVSAGYWYTCALTDANGGSVYCWGDNNGSKLGIGAQADVGASSATPVRVKTSASAFLAGVTDMVVGYGGGCVVRTDHSLYCWGGTAGDFATPMQTAAKTPIMDAVKLATNNSPINVRYLSQSGIYWILGNMLMPNCGIEE